METTPPTPVRPALPADFIAQLFARLFNHPSPKFFQILSTIILVLGTLLACVKYVDYDLAGQGQTPPGWLHWIEIGLQGLLDVSGLVVAKATIQTPSTPALTADTPQPTVKELAAQVAELRSQLARPTPPTDISQP